MNKILNASKQVIFVIAFITIGNLTTSAQPNPGGPGIGTNGSGGNGSGYTNDNAAPSNSPAVPFDGGMSLMLIASGIGYSAKKLRKKVK